MSAIGLDLFINAAIALAASTLLVLLVARVTKRWAGPWQQLLFALPFLKAILEIARGVPEHAFHWARIAGAEHESGSFNIGFGLSRLRLQITGQLAAHADGLTYPTSAGEMLSRKVEAIGGASVVDGIVLGVLAIASLLVLRRIVAAIVFEGRRRKLRKSATPLSRERVGFRWVDVYVADETAQSPYCGGLLEPFVCFPRAVYEAMTDDERTSALAHELAHIRRHDLVVAMLAAFLTDLLWFCPGARTLRRRIADRIELDADRSAVARGAAPTSLASALMRLAEVRSNPARAGVLSMSTSAGRRIRALLAEPPPAPRYPRLRAIGLLAIASFTANTIVFAVFLGNY